MDKTHSKSDAHPRDEDGKFVEKGAKDGGKSGSSAKGGDHTGHGGSSTKSEHKSGSSRSK